MRLPAARTGLILVILVSGPVMGDEARAWLERMIQATDSHSYEGTFVHRSGDRMETMRVVHRVQGTSVRERLWSEDEPGREVIRSEDRVTCIFGDQRSVLVEGRGPGDPGSLAERLPRFDEQLRAYYEFVLLGADRKLKRSAVVLKVKPRDGYRYGYKLWVDRSTAMPLKVQMLGEDGEAVEDFQFTQLELDVEIPDSRLEPSLALDEFTWHHQETGDRESLDSPSWLAADLPDGFRLELAERRQDPDGDEEILQLIYTDGLASVSVFIEPLVASRQPMGGFSRLGAANAYSTRHTEVQVTAMGEVPRRTVRRIAESVGPAP